MTGVGHDTIIMSFNHTNTSSSSSSTRPQHESSSTSAAISSGAPTTTTTTATTGVGGGAAGPSQAKRRLEAMTASIDHKLAAVFTVILVFYSMVTFGTWVRIESQEITTPVMSALTTRHSVATTRTTTTTTTTTTSAKNNNNNNNSGQQLAVGAGGIIVPKMVRLEDIHDIETLQHTFPVHVGDDMEEIDHPGIFMADKAKMAAMFENHPELPRNGKMRVPKFWKPVAYGEKGVRGFLGEDGKRLITPEEAKAIGSFDPATGRETIYVSVASYRDWECQPTVEDMFLRAEHPERLRVAIIDQRAENDSVQPCAVPEKPCSEDPSQTLCRFHHLIDRYEVPAHLSVGPVFARHLANRMYRGKSESESESPCKTYEEYKQLQYLVLHSTRTGTVLVRTKYIIILYGTVLTHPFFRQGNILPCKWTVTSDSFEIGIAILFLSGSLPRMKWECFPYTSRTLSGASTLSHLRTTIQRDRLCARQITRVMARCVT